MPFRQRKTAICHAKVSHRTSNYFYVFKSEKSKKDDWRKLKIVLQLLYHTINKPRIIGASSHIELFKWINAAFAVHPHMGSQTGGCMSFGWGTILGPANKIEHNQFH